MCGGKNFKKNFQKLLKRWNTVLYNIEKEVRICEQMIL